MTATEVVPTTPIAVLPPAEKVPADRHPAAVYLARLGAGSRRAMRQALEVIAALVSGQRLAVEHFPWAALRYPYTAGVRAQLMGKYSPAAANKILAALRGVLQEAWRLGYMTAEDYHRAADVPNIKAQTLPRGRALAGGEISALLAACADDRSPAGARDAALIAVLYGAGLRRSEAVALDLADYNRAIGELAIRGAKGRKDRLAYATNGAADALADWIALRGQEPGPLLVPVNKGGRLGTRRMTDQAVLVILVKRAAAAGVPAFSPHDLRRSFISDLLDRGADISTAQHLAGHANVQTTARYDRRGEAAKRKAAELLHVPYFGRARKAKK
jgi:site-specific recombinase XerD